MAPFNSPGRGPKGSARKTPAHPPKLDVSRLEDRDVPASTFSGTVFLDTNANGRFDVIPTLVNNPGAGLTPLTAEIGWNGLNQPWDPVGTRVPVTVRAFDSANTLQGTATTDSTGAYTLTVAAAGAYRLEFSNLPNGVSFGPSGQQTGTAVQTAPTSLPMSIRPTSQAARRAKTLPMPLRARSYFPSRWPSRLIANLPPHRARRAPTLP